MRQVSLSKKRETYYKMAEVLKVDVNYLLIGDEEFLMITGAKYVNKETKLLISEVTKLFASGDLADVDKTMKRLQEAY